MTQKTKIPGPKRFIIHGNRYNTIKDVSITRAITESIFQFMIWAFALTAAQSLNMFVVKTITKKFKDNLWLYLLWTVTAVCLSVTTFVIYFFLSRVGPEEGEDDDDDEDKVEDDDENL